MKRLLLLLFIGTLSWRTAMAVYCCNNNQQINSYSGCNRHLAQDCGSGQNCVQCNCYTFHRVTVPAQNKCNPPTSCPYAGIHDFGSYQDAVNWEVANEHNSCPGYPGCLTLTTITSQTDLRYPVDNHCDITTSGDCAVNNLCAAACYSH